MTSRQVTRMVSAVAALVATQAISQEAGPLHLRVNPTGYERPPETRPRETLEQKLARRTREEYRFRSICRGCLPAEIEARMDAAGARPRPVEPVAEAPPEAQPQAPLAAPSDGAEMP